MCRSLKRFFFQKNGKLEYFTFVNLGSISFIFLVFKVKLPLLRKFFAFKTFGLLKKKTLFAALSCAPCLPEYHSTQNLI